MFLNLLNRVVTSDYYMVVIILLMFGLVFSRYECKYRYERLATVVAAICALIDFAVLALPSDSWLSTAVYHDWGLYALIVAVAVNNFIMFIAGVFALQAMGPVSVGAKLCVAYQVLTMLLMATGLITGACCTLWYEHNVQVGWHMSWGQSTASVDHMIDLSWSWMSMAMPTMIWASLTFIVCLAIELGSDFIANRRDKRGRRAAAYGR